MKKISQSQFARECGLAVSQIAQVINRGDLEATQEGRNVYLDLTHPKTRAFLERYANRDFQKRKRKNGNGNQQNGDNSCMSIDEQSALGRKLKQMLGVDASLDDFNNLSEAFTNKLKTLGQIQDLQIRTGKVRKQLVDRDTVAKMFSKIYTIDVNEFRMLGRTLAPELASIASVDDPATVVKMTEKIDEEVFQILEHVKELLNGFLLEMELEGVLGDVTN